MAEEYEKLRPTGAGVVGSVMRWGRALLMGRGLAAWLEALSTSPAPRSEEQYLGPPGEASSVTQAPLSAQAYREVIDDWSSDFERGSEGT